MFTGIIKKVGKIKIIDPPASALSASDWRAGKSNSRAYFTIEAKNFLVKTKVGDSISCDGVCLTVIKKIKDSFKVELMAETLKLTNFKSSKIGDLINLELAMKIGDRIDGHFVSGHIDGVGKIIKVVKVGNNKELAIKVPKKIMKYLAYKGSVSVNGVSLTISGIGKDWFKISLISHTLKNTNLSKLKTGDLVNIEVDVIARYLDALRITN